MKQLNYVLKFLNAGFTFIEHFLAMFPILISFSKYIVFYGSIEVTFLKKAYVGIMS